jgi:hypothetical protein
VAGYPALRVATLLHDALEADVKQWALWDPKQTGGQLHVAGLLHLAEPNEAARLNAVPDSERYERVWAGLRCSPANERRAYFVVHLQTARLFGCWGKRTGNVHSLRLIDLPMFHRNLLHGFMGAVRHRQRLVLEELGLACSAIVLDSVLLAPGRYDRPQAPVQPAAPEDVPAAPPVVDVSPRVTRMTKSTPIETPKPQEAPVAPAATVTATIPLPPLPPAKKTVAAAVSAIQAPGPVVLPVEEHEEERLVLVTKRRTVSLPLAQLRRLLEQAIGRPLPADAILRVQWGPDPKSPALGPDDAINATWTETVEERDPR